VEALGSVTSSTSVGSRMTILRRKVRWRRLLHPAIRLSGAGRGLQSECRIDGRYHPLVVIRLVEGGAPIGIGA
jgi:hypothetical protein